MCLCVFLQGVVIQLTAKPGLLGCWHIAVYEFNGLDDEVVLTGPASDEIRGHRAIGRCGSRMHERRINNPQIIAGTMPAGQIGGRCNRRIALKTEQAAGQIDAIDDALTAVSL